MNEIKVSILVPAFNAGLYIEGCLRSLISQTRKDIEVIVTDDGSTDHTAELAERLAHTDCRIQTAAYRWCGNRLAKVCPKRATKPCRWRKESSSYS